MVEPVHRRKVILRSQANVASVVIPCYNHAKVLKQAIESVPIQSYSDFEVHRGETKAQPLTLPKSSGAIPRSRCANSSRARPLFGIASRQVYPMCHCLFYRQNCLILCTVSTPLRIPWPPDYRHILGDEDCVTYEARGSTEVQTSTNVLHLTKRGCADQWL